MENQNISEKDSVRVDQYVLNRMSPAEKSSFEEELAINEALRREVSFRTAVQKGFRQEINKDLKGRLQEIHNETVRPSSEAPVTPRKFSGINRWLAIAASVALIMAVTYWIAGGFGGGYEELYASYYEQPAYSVPRGSATETLGQAAESYNQGDYDEAALLFETYLRDEGGDANIRFMAAVSYLEEGNYKNAKAHLLQVIEEGGPLSNKAAWYLALTYLKEDNLRECHFWLETLSTNENARPYNTKAEKLLKKLD